MIRRWSKHILLATALLTGGSALSASAAQWESLRSERSDAKLVTREEGIEIKTARLTIIVNVSKPVNVKVYTILGQLVSSETVGSGSSQLHLPSHGVYIIKIGSFTCKVAL